MSIIDEITKGLQTGNALAPLVVGLIAMLKFKGDTRTDEEILAEAESIAKETKAIAEGDM